MDIIELIDEWIDEAENEPSWKATQALRCLRKEIKKRGAIMSFRQAFFEMLNGKHIAHELWKGGYWAWENNTIMIHCYDGKVLDIRETENTAYTFGFIVEDRWYVKE